MRIKGEPVTWKTVQPGARGGGPHHDEVAAHYGLPYAKGAGWSDRVVISPSGWYTSVHSGGDLEDPTHFARAIPGMKYIRDLNKWQMRTDPELNPERYRALWGGTPPWESSKLATPQGVFARPIIAHPQGVFIGQPSEAHSEMILNQGLYNRLSGPEPSMGILHGNMAGNNYAEWYNHVPMPELQKKIRQVTGRDWIHSMENPYEAAQKNWATASSIMSTVVSDSRFKQSAWGLTRDELPPEQRAIWKTKPRSDEFQNFLRNPVPGTRLWRGEQRPTGFTPDQGAGMHWTMMPNAVIVPRTDPGHQPVVWQGTMGDNPKNQMFPREHPMWGGQHRSIDWEGEYRLRPNTQLDLEGYWQPNREDFDHGFFPYEDYEGKSPADRGWEFTPVGQRIPIHNRGHLPYSDVFEHDINAIPGHNQLWDQYEQSQRPSDFRVNMDKTDYVTQHSWEGNPWGIGYGGPRPWAKEPEDPMQVARELWGD